MRPPNVLSFARCRLQRDMFAQYYDDYGLAKPALLRNRDKAKASNPTAQVAAVAIIVVNQFVAVSALASLEEFWSQRNSRHAMLRLLDTTVQLNLLLPQVVVNRVPAPQLSKSQVGVMITLITLT